MYSLLISNLVATEISNESLHERKESLTDSCCTVCSTTSGFFFSSMKLVPQHMAIMNCGFKGNAVASAHIKAHLPENRCEL